MDNYNNYNNYDNYNNSNYGYSYNEPAYSTYGSISDRSYYSAIMVFLLWGFAANFVLCTYFAELFYNLDFRVMIIGYFVLCFGGMAINKISKNWFVSFIGYNMVVLPIGILLSFVLQYYSPAIVQYAFLGTALITAIMTILAFIYPAAFAGLGRTLCISLLCTIVVELILTLIGINLAVIDYIVVAIFSLYIGYDLSKAQMRPRTLDNAVDVAFELYLDIINIFLRILSILGKRK